MIWLTGPVLCQVPMLIPLLLAMLSVASLIECGGSKKRAKDGKKNTKEDNSSDMGRGREEKSGGQPRASSKPTQMAGTHDPNYQTLAAVPGGCFGADKKGASTAGGRGAEGPKAPAVDGVAGTHDPNYQTLAGVGGECFGADKKPCGEGAAAGGGNKMAGTHDPNYQTLAGIGGDVFGQDKKGGGGGGAPVGPPGGKAMAGTHDPNYQTLAGIGGDCFGQDKKK